MRSRKRNALKKRGWKIGSSAEFLDLVQQEVEVIELKISLGIALRARRQRRRVTQATLAQAISSSQSRVAKMEAGDPSVSIDLLIKSMFVLGASRRDVANAISRKSNTRK